MLGTIFGWPIFWFLIRRREKYFSEKSSLRVLIIPQLNRIGDLVCATPVFRAIKKRYPESFVAVLVTSRTSDLLKANPNIDEIIRYRTSHFMSVLKNIRERKFNWCLSLSGTAISTIVAVWSLIPNRAKISRPDKPIGEQLTDWLIPHRIMYQHHTYLPAYYLKLLEFLGIQDAEEVKQVFVTEEADEKVKEWLSANHIAPTDVLVGISITAGNKIKEWGDENFRKVAEYAVQLHGAKVIFIGGKNDKERIEKIKNGLDQSKFFCAADFNLEELPSLIKRLNLYIAVDTGPIYIAHALRVPLIDIVGPCDPNEQPPNDEISIQVRPPTYISPSSFVMKKAGRPEEHRRTLEAIKPEEVIDAVKRVLML